MKFETKEKRTQFIEDNLNLVPYTLHKRNLPINDDILQEGYCYLCLLVDNYDESKNVAFSTYAISSLYFYLLRYINVKDKLIKPIRLLKKSEDQKSWYIQAQICSLDSSIAKNDSNEDFNTEDLLIQKALESSVITVSLEDEIISEIYVNTFIKSLNDIEQNILNLYSSYKTQKEIAKQLNISQPRVSRILNKIYDKYLVYSGKD